MSHIFIGELLGTFILVLLGGGSVANVVLKASKGEHSGWMVVTTGWFVAVVLGVFVAQSSGSINADINPAVSFSKFLLGFYSFSHMCIMMLAQLVGAFLGAIFVWLTYLPHWKLTENKITKLMVFSTVPAVRSYPANFLCEVIASVVLVVGVAAVFGHATLGHPATGMGPYLVGVLVWGIGLSLGGPTGYAINPARDLGPRLAHALLPISGKGTSDWAYAWVPVFGPLLGAVVGAVLWRVFFLGV